MNKLLTNEDVGDRPHPAVGHDDPDDDEVAARSHCGHGHEEHAPHDLTPEGHVVHEVL